jgi:hypothetical protein
MINYLSSIDLFEGNGLEGFGPLGTPNGNAPSLFNKFLTSLIGIITVVAFIWVVILIVSGGIGIITSAGDKAGLQSNLKKIANGIIGLVVLISALFIMQVFGKLFGIDNILNPAYFIEHFTLQ